MEELFELNDLLLTGNFAEALLLVEDMTEMSKDDKLVSQAPARLN